MTLPTGAPSSNTGTCENPSSRIVSTASRTGSSGATDTTPRFITSSNVTSRRSTRFNASTKLRSVEYDGSTSPSSTRATNDWLTPASRASFSCVNPNWTRFDFKSRGVGNDNIATPQCRRPISAFQSNPPRTRTNRAARG